MDGAYRVAIVDDSPEDLKLLGLILTRAGHHVAIEARSGQELLDSFGVVTTDLVIADLRMPGMDGIELAEKLAVSYDVPIIIVSASDDDASAAQTATLVLESPANANH